MPDSIYLDHAATTLFLPEARDAMLRAFDEAPGNASSAHAAGRRARRVLEDARERMAALLKTRPNDVIFTSGATEANNLALFGLAGDPPGRIVASPIEHPCVVEPLQQLAKRGFEIEFLPVGRDGIVDVSSMPPDCRFATVQLVNHETGASQFAIRNPQSAIHTDAAQALGKTEVDFGDLGVAAMTMSAHKFGGPPGIGALVLRDDVKFRPLLFGGHQQQGRRPGTEPVALAAGMAAALDLSIRNLATTCAHVAQLHQRFLERLSATAAPIVVNSPPNAIPHILNVSFPGCPADRLLIALDLAGVACSTGSACSSGSLLPSPVLQAMQVPDDVLRSAMRFSFAASNTFAEVEEAADRVSRAVAQFRH